MSLCTCCLPLPGLDGAAPQAPSQLHPPLPLHHPFLCSITASPSPSSPSPAASLPSRLSLSLVPKDPPRPRAHPCGCWGRGEHLAAFLCSQAATWDCSQPVAFLPSFSLPWLRILHRSTSPVDGKKGNGAKLLPGTTGSRAPVIWPRSTSLDASWAGFLCSLCDFFIQAIDIGFSAHGHFQSHKSAVLL